MTSIRRIKRRMKDFNPLQDPCLSCGLWVGKKHPCIRPKGEMARQSLDIRPPEKNLTTGGIVLIGEAPGNEEDSSGTAFVGPAGRTLRAALDRLGITDFTLLNAVCCRPTKGISNRTPSTQEVDSCSSFLHDTLFILEPRLILCLGLIAAKSLGLSGKMRDLRNREWSIDRHTWTARRSPEHGGGDRMGTSPGGLGGEENPSVPVGEGTVPVYVTYHPAASMRPGQKHLAQVMEDDIALYIGRAGVSKLANEAGLNPAAPMALEGSIPSPGTTCPEYSETAMDAHGGVYFPSSARKQDTPEMQKALDKTGEVWDNRLMVDENHLVLDIETSSFLRGHDIFPWGGKEEIWLIGTDKGGWESPTLSQNESKNTEPNNT